MYTDIYGFLVPTSILSSSSHRLEVDGGSRSMVLLFDASVDATENICKYTAPNLHVPASHVPDPTPDSAELYISNSPTQDDDSPHSGSNDQFSRRCLSPPSFSPAVTPRLPFLPLLMLQYPDLVLQSTRPAVNSSVKSEPARPSSTGCIKSIKEVPKIMNPSFTAIPNTVMSGSTLQSLWKAETAGVRVSHPYALLRQNAESRRFDKTGKGMYRMYNETSEQVNEVQRLGVTDRWDKSGKRKDRRGRKNDCYSELELRSLMMANLNEVDSLFELCPSSIQTPHLQSIDILTPPRDDESAISNSRGTIIDSIRITPTRLDMTSPASSTNRSSTPGRSGGTPRFRYRSRPMFDSTVWLPTLPGVINIPSSGPRNIIVASLWKRKYEVSVTSMGPER